MGHTKGEWKVGFGQGLPGGNTPSCQPFCRKDLKFIPISKGEDTIAIVPDQLINFGFCSPGKPFNNGTMESNAQLISAAPDLLVVCKAVLKEMIYLESLDENVITLSGLTTDALKDAINKATKEA